MENAVSKDVAIKEINEWLDFKKVKQKKRESNEDSINTLVESIESGDLEFNEETKDLTMKLSFGIGSNEQVKQLVFKPRLKLGDVHKHLKRVKSGDTDGRLLAYVYALTGQPSAMIDELDTEDYSLALSIAIFFI